MTGSWTRHKPEPASDDVTLCGVCGQPITRYASVYRHVRTLDAPVTMNKPTYDSMTRLYERLDAILAVTESTSTAITDASAELIEVLMFLHHWSFVPEVWNTVKKWCKDHEGKM